MWPVVSFKSLNDLIDLVTYNYIYTAGFSYNWPNEGNHHADVTLCKNEFDSPAVENKNRNIKKGGCKKPEIHRTGFQI